MTDEQQHLEFIQAVIRRLAHNSFLIKGWAITVSTAVYGFAAASQLNWQVAVFGVIPAAGFWFLDSFYLHQERLFRHLFADAVSGTVARYSMDVARYKEMERWRKAFLSVTLVTFYGLTAVIGATLTFAAYLHDATPSEDPPATLVGEP